MDHGGPRLESNSAKVFFLSYPIHLPTYLLDWLTHRLTPWSRSLQSLRYSTFSQLFYGNRSFNYKSPPLVPILRQIHLNTEIQWTLEFRTIWSSNNLKLEQKLESRTKDHVVVTWSPSLCVVTRTRSCLRSSPETGSVRISQIQSVFKRLIYFFGLFLYYLQ
jgi:hypothetical protein